MAAALSLTGICATVAAGQDPGTSCPVDSGYALSMQDLKTDKVMGVYYVKSMKALSINSKGALDKDQGHTIDADSMQLNTYLRGRTATGKKVVY